MTRAEAWLQVMSAAISRWGASTLPPEVYAALAARMADLALQQFEARGGGLDVPFLCLHAANSSCCAGCGGVDRKTLVGSEHAAGCPRPGTFEDLAAAAGAPESSATLNDVDA